MGGEGVQGYLFAEALSQPALPEGDGQASAVEDPQGAGDPQHMPARLGVVTVTQRKTGGAVLLALLGDLHAGLAQNVITQVIGPARNKNFLGLVGLHFSLVSLNQCFIL